MEFPSELWTCLRDFFLCTLALVVSGFSRFTPEGLHAWVRVDV